MRTLQPARASTASGPGRACGRLAAAPAPPLPLAARRHEASAAAFAPKPAAAPLAAAAPGRREALVAAVAAVASLALPRSALADAEDSAVVIAGITGERWNAVDATLTLPPGWARRAGSRAKTSKTLLYTDTYGPSYRYVTALPRFTTADGAFAAESINLQVSGRTGTDAITDLGPQSGIDPARAFELTEIIDDIVLADVVTAAARTDKAGQSYYEWELKTPGGHHVLLTAAATGGGFLVLSVDASAEQWAASGAALKALQASFVLPPSAETTLDASQRIYAKRKSGGFK